MMWYAMAKMCLITCVYIYRERERCVYVVVCDETYHAVGCIGFQKMKNGFLHCIPHMPQLYMDNPQYKPL